MRDVIHFTPVTAQDSYGACGSYAPFFSAEWKRVTCPECLKLQRFIESVSTKSTEKAEQEEA